MLGASAQDGRREQKMCFYAFAMGRKRLRMSHVQVGCGQAEPQTWSTSECGKCWHEIGDWLYDWWWRNLVLATIRCAPSSEKIWVSGRSVPGLWWRYPPLPLFIYSDWGISFHCSWFVPHKLTDEQKANGWKPLEISLACVTRIHPFCEPSSQGMRPGATISIQNSSGTWWTGVHHRPHKPKMSRLQKIQGQDWRASWKAQVFQECVTAVLQSIPKKDLRWQFPEALWTLQKACCEGWRLFWRPIKEICFRVYHSPNFFFRHTSYIVLQQWRGLINAIFALYSLMA